MTKRTGAVAASRSPKIYGDLAVFEVFVVQLSSATINDAAYRWSSASLQRAVLPPCLVSHAMAATQPDDKADQCAAAQFQRFVAPLVPGGTFDEPILADEDGTVLFPTARSGMRVTNIAHIFAEPNPSIAGGSGNGQKQASSPPAK